MTSIFAVLLAAFAARPALASLCNFKPEDAQEHSAALAKAAPPIMIAADDPENAAPPDSDLCRARTELDAYVGQLGSLARLKEDYPLGQKVRLLKGRLGALVDQVFAERLGLPDIFDVHYKAVRKYLSSDEKSLIWNLKVGLAAKDTPAARSIVNRARK